MSEDSALAVGEPLRVGPGSRVAGYRIERMIGQGGMAVVFRAHDERLDRSMALKILSQALGADPRAAAAGRAVTAFTRASSVGPCMFPARGTRLICSFKA